MSFARYIRHLTAGKRKARRLFGRDAARRIRDAIQKSEERHRGQIRFVAESSLPSDWLFRKRTARERAVHLFSTLRVWDTEENCGVLIYLLLAERKIEIVADRGIHIRAQENAWRDICTFMEQHFREGRFEVGVLLGIEKVTELLSSHYPATGSTARANELPDWPVFL